VANPKDPHPVTLKIEKDPVIAYLEAQRAREAPMQAGSITAAGPGIMQDTVEDSHRRLAVKATNICSCLVQPLNFEGWRHLLG
jgi:hypothetical protein